jgi:hypothetical protein
MLLCRRDVLCTQFNMLPAAVPELDGGQRKAVANHLGATAEAIRQVSPTTVACLPGGQTNRGTGPPACRVHQG